tara:strand:+ start:2537 stop:3580 length:1044 start_codon:yes stop_codon:yes gene_type:complete
MKINRHFIHRIIKEAMYSPSSVSQKFAIWADYFEDTEYPEGAVINFIMYDWDWALQRAGMFYQVNDNADGYDIINFISSKNENGLSPIAAVMRVRTPGPDVYGECNGAWEVVRSAAEGGYGPTLYDIVMSISPNGLTSDRSSVSGEASKVWAFYANQRANVEKLFLDPSEYTYTEEDDCMAHGEQGVGSLHSLTRIMAVDYFKENWPVEYEAFEEEIDMDILMDWGTLSGDEYFQNVAQWIEANQDDLELEEWNIDDAMDQWFEYRMEHEMELIDNKDGGFDHPEYLNLSYNTSYAADSYEDMRGNHFDFLEMLATEFEDDDAQGEFEEVEMEEAETVVRDYFKDKY